MTTRREITKILFVVLVVPMAVFLGYGFIYQPLKFRCLISQVESARTPAEERAAFILAAQRGRVFELNWLRPGELPERARHSASERVLELQWLESSAWIDQPYSAYRRVLDPDNMEILYGRYDYNGQPPW